MIYQVYARYGGMYKDKSESLESAIHSLRVGNEYGECFPIGVYDSEANELYIPDSEPIGVSSPDYRLEDVRQICELPEDHVFAALHRRSFHFDYEE